MSRSRYNSLGKALGIWHWVLALRRPAQPPKPVFHRLFPVGIRPHRTDANIPYRQLHALPLKHPIRKLGCFERAHRLLVDEEFDGGLVGVDLDVGRPTPTPRPRREAAAGDVDDGLIGPACLVEVEGVLFEFAVVGDDAFVVEGLEAAFLADWGCEVEGVPEEDAPEPVAVLHDVPGGFVEEGLVFLGVPGSVVDGHLRVGEAAFVMLGVGACAVFGDADGAGHWAGGDFGVELVDLGPVVVGIDVPAVVAVEGDCVGDVVEFVGRAAVVGEDDGARGVEGFGEVVELPREGGAFVVCAAHPEFVGNSPDDDGGVIEVLLDHLAELLLDVGGELLSVRDAVYQRDFGPDEEAVFVAEGVGVLGVRVVGEADAAGAHFEDEVEILLVIFARDGPAFVFAVLMAVGAAEGVFLVVEDEALVGIEFDGAEAEGLGDGIGDDLIWGVAVESFDGDGVEVRRRGAAGAMAIPEDGAIDVDVVGDFTFPIALVEGPAWCGCGGGCRGDLFAVGVVNGGADDGVPGLKRAVAKLGGDADDGTLGSDIGLEEVDAGRGIVGGIDGAGIEREEMDVPVYAPENREIAGNRGDVGEFGVVGADGDDVFAGLERGGGVEAECSEGAAVLAELGAVDEDIGDCGDGFEAEVGAFGGVGTGGFGREGDGFAIPGWAAVVVGFGLCVGGVPGVGDVYFLPGRVVKGGGFGAGDIFADEAPVVVDEDVLAGGGGEGAEAEERCTEEEKESGHGGLLGRGRAVSCQLTAGRRREEQIANGQMANRKFGTADRNSEIRNPKFQISNPKPNSPFLRASVSLW